MTNPLIPNLDVLLEQAEAFLVTGRQYLDMEQELRSLHEQIAQLVARRALLATQITAAHAQEAEEDAILGEYDVSTLGAILQSNPILLALLQEPAPPSRGAEQVRAHVAPLRASSPESTPAPQAVLLRPAPSTPLWQAHPEPLVVPTPVSSSAPEQARDAEEAPPASAPALAAALADPEDAGADAGWSPALADLLASPEDAGAEAGGADWAEDLLPTEEDAAQAPPAAGLDWKEALTPAPAAPFRAPTEEARSAPGGFKHMVQNLFGGNGTNA